MSEAELDAVLSQLRTDKNLILPATPAQRERWGSLTERLLLGTASTLSPLELAAAREEAALQAWHIALGDKAVGPVDIEALRGHWERGEVGPESLCWRKGFEGWQPICRVQGLVEVLAPRPDSMPEKPEDLVPKSGSHALDFPLRGAEALRVLSDELPPPLPRPATLLPFFLEPEPALAPELSDEPPTQPEALNAAGMHPVLSTSQPTQVEVRLRGGVWLALGGGLAGGLLVACVMWLMGMTATLGVFPRGGAPEPTSRAGTTTDALSAGASSKVAARAGATEAASSASAASAPGSTAALPAPVAALPSGTALATTSMGALPPPGVGVPPLLAPVPGPAFGWGSTLGNVHAPLGTSAMPLSPRTSPTPTGTETVALSKRVAAPVRPSPQDPPLLKPAKAEVHFEPTPAAEERVAARAAAEEEEAEAEDDLGLDEEFERELEGAGKRATEPTKRTAWIPPAPASVETPASLSQSDIFSGVVANKGDVAACVAAQKLQSEEGARRVVVSWTILPSGKVTEVVTETAEYRGTPLALCLEGKIRGWTFPKHREQGGPVRFPFVF